ncbi:endonuclease III domain-containing protein [Tundrisphaera sp. TA3]|uniref:endonuclease III domain-containing protein n=1 Tax=Tundrisphaera sp. TA3 TaxID=3435775 RepID=UPI003EB8EB93
MPRLDDSRPALLDAIQSRYGPPAPSGRGPGPDDDPFARILVEALGLSADPRTVASALTALAAEGLLDPAALAAADPSELEALFQAHRIRLTAKAVAPALKLARWVQWSGFDRAAAEVASTEALREAWRGLRGIGQATADALLLHALDRPAYPVDRGSYRIFLRHGWIDASADYDEARSVFESVAPDDAPTLVALSAGLQRLAREFCKPGTPRCEHCPLRPLLPEGGPLGEE